jgi:hypothetical protein
MVQNSSRGGLHAEAVVMFDSWDANGYVLPDGSPGGIKVLRRETLYVGLNGNRVERFWDARRSYIYKPVGFPKTAGRERWVARHLKPLLRGIRMPEIVASSDSGAQPPDGAAWIIYEDLGELSPPGTVDDVVKAAGWAAKWHRLPLDVVPASFDGHTPNIRDVTEALAQDAGLEKRLARAGAAQADKWAARLPELGRRLFRLDVVCHGDYHPGNIAMNFAEPVVLDWEFVHRNHPYWDLYCLMDITSFRYRKVPLDNRGRVRALRRYLDALTDKPAGLDRLSLTGFAEGYAVYAAVYSTWILGLIERDLLTGRAERQPLERQWRETAGVLNDCLTLLGPDGVKGECGLP